MDAYVAVDGTVGRTVLPVDDPAITLGWSVFETMLAEGGVVNDLDAHLARLRRSAAAAEVPWPDADLASEVRAAATVAPLARLRVTLTGGGHRIVQGHAADPARRFATVRVVTGPAGDEPWLGRTVKHGSRAPWVVAVRRSGADDVVLVRSGRFAEATTAAVIAVVNGELWAAHDDVLPSVTADRWLALARRLGIRVHHRGADVRAHLDGMYLASATRELAPVVELDGVARIGPEPVGRALVAAAGVDPWPAG